MHQLHVFRLPELIPSEFAAPLMCAGATVFPPFLRNSVRPGQRVAVVGVGGLGHLALQFARAWGCEVTGVSMTADKEADSRKFGAHHFLLSSNADAARKSHAQQFDFMLITVPKEIDWSFYMDLVKSNGIICLVGLPGAKMVVPVAPFIMRGLHIVAGPGCTRQEYREMIRFAALHQIRPQIELAPMKDINLVLDKARKNTVRYRAVLTN